MSFTTTGYQTLTADEVLAEVQQAYIATFGSNFNLLPTSINGQMIQNDTNMAIDVENSRALLFGSLYNPNQANGVWLDSIAKFNNITRKSATSSSVTCQITGLPNTVISVNSKVLNANGDEFYNPSLIVIGTDGTASGNFVSSAKGAINCDANTITKIVQSVAGWDSVNNSSAGTLGTGEETDQELRYRRAYSLAINSAGGLDSIISALSNLTGVVNFTVVENYTSVAKLIQGVSVNPFTVYCSVQAPSSLDEDIARILYTKRYCGMQGNYNYTITDSNYSWVTFEATWQKPTEQNLQIDIVFPDSPSYPSNIVDLVKQSVIDNFEGNQYPAPGYDMTTNEVIASQFSYALNLVGVFNYTSIEVGILSGTMGASVSLPIDQVFVLGSSNINVTVTS